MAAKKPKLAVVQANPEEKLSLHEKLARRQRERADAFAKLEKIYDELGSLDYESLPLNEVLDGRELPESAQKAYQARLDEVCAREKVLLPQLRDALTAFLIADVAVAMAGGHAAEGFVVAHMSEERNKDNPAAAQMSAELRADPLYAEYGFDFESYCSFSYGQMRALAKAYPELA